MNRNKKNISTKAPADNTRPGTSVSGNNSKSARKTGTKSWLPYAIGFVLLWIFSAFIYGDVFLRAEQESFVTFDAGQMKFLTDQPWGGLYWVARFVLLVFKSPLLGGLFLALIGTLTACLFDKLLRLPQQWRGLGFLLPTIVLAFFVWRGLNLYFYSEPSIIVWLPLALLLLVAVIYGVVALLRRKPADSPSRQPRFHWAGSLLIVVMSAGLYGFALTYGQNTRLASRIQNRVATADWEGIISDALAARRPTRTIAAYHAAALVQTNQLLDRLFEIPYDFPDAGLDDPSHADEGKNYIPDANFYAGLVNSSYRMCMEKMEMEGPSLFTMKRMVVCAILNGEEALAKKYLHIIGCVPFEKAFVERYSPLVGNEELIKADPELACVRSLKPLEQKFEQQYRPVAFLGYNYGVSYGTDATLITSVAVALYTKDLQNLLIRASYMRQKQALPQVVKQALVLAALNNPQVMGAFPEIDAITQSQVKAFMTAAAPYKGDREKMREALKKDWEGTYIYYYYLGNLQSEAPKTDETKEKGGVN